MKPNCCNNPQLDRDQPAPDDADEMVRVNCGHCGHDYGQIPLSEAEALVKKAGVTVAVTNHEPTADSR